MARKVSWYTTNCDLSTVSDFLPASEDAHNPGSS